MDCHEFVKSKLNSTGHFLKKGLAGAENIYKLLFPFVAGFLHAPFPYQHKS